MFGVELAGGTILEDRLGDLLCKGASGDSFVVEQKPGLPDAAHHATERRRFFVGHQRLLSTLSSRSRIDQVIQ